MTARRPVLDAHQGGAADTHHIHIARGTRTGSGTHLRPVRQDTNVSTESARPQGADPGAELEADTTVHTTILPADHDRAEVLAQVRRERARRELTLGAIRAHLQEQPSPHSIRACARRWCTTIANLADDVVKARQNTETNE